MEAEARRGRKQQNHTDPSGKSMSSHLFCFMPRKKTHAISSKSLICGASAPQLIGSRCSGDFQSLVDPSWLRSWILSDASTSDWKHRIFLSALSGGKNYTLFRHSFQKTNRNKPILYHNPYHSTKVHPLLKPKNQGSFSQLPDLRDLRVCDLRGVGVEGFVAAPVDEGLEALRMFLHRRE